MRREVGRRKGRGRGGDGEGEELRGWERGKERCEKEGGVSE